MRRGRSLGPLRSWRDGVAGVTFVALHTLGSGRTGGACDPCRAYLALAAVGGDAQHKYQYILMVVLRIAHFVFTALPYGYNP